MPNYSHQNMKIYQATAIFSIIFALIGFSYNVWRMEASETNNNARTASFEVLKELSEFEQIVYLAHYDHDPDGGNPRKGWGKVILINDLSLIISPKIELTSQQLKNTWQNNWQQLGRTQQAADDIILAIDILRQEIKQYLITLT